MRHHTEPLTPAEDAAIELPTVDRSERFPMDQLIRSRGYVVRSRPKTGPVLWSLKRSDVLLTERKVMDMEQLG